MSEKDKISRVDTEEHLRYKGGSFKNMKNESWSLALKVMANISGWIAFPVIIGLFLGKWLDDRYGTAPWLFLITIGGCFVVSLAGLVRYALREFKEAERAVRSRSAQDETEK